ncbi:hypothetical protein PybrP1_009733 [[Pythium] brassicae (nom. inval.)]|nr:hypothetical protein PybrP1_009733 [[Pythium] brassicae (nom. inval.)]
MQQKSVRWSTITVYEFGVGIGGSAVPKRGGPAVGLARRPECVWSTTVDAVRGAPLREVAVAALNDDDARKASSQCVGPPKRCRPRRVRWLKPLERVSMLEKAGYSERRIYRMLMESSQIAMSRRLCLRLAVDTAAAAAASVAVRSQ